MNLKYQQLLQNCIKYGSSSDGKIGKTKLAKLAYLVDFVYFYYNFESITNLEYKKLSEGPVPIEYFQTINFLFESSQIDIKIKGTAQLISLIEEVETTELNKEELDLIIKISQKWKAKNTQSIVEFTHNQLPWKISFDNQKIPYSLITQEEERNLY